MTPAVLAVVAALGAGVWWLWPTLAGPSHRTEVLVVGNGDLASAGPMLERRLREVGFAVVTEPTVADWCSAQGAIPTWVSDLQPGVVVLGIGDLGGCGDDPLAAVFDGLAHTDVVVVSEPGNAAVRVVAVAQARRLTLVDPVRLLGVGPSSSQPCQSWDVDCPLGTVEVRDGAARLTAAGAERLARMIVAEIP